MKKYIYPLCVLLSAIFWGTSGCFVRILTSLNFSTYEVVFLRLLSALLILIIGFSIFNRKAFKISLKDLWCFIGTGVVGLLGTSICYFSTIKSASLSTACILMYTAPIFVIVFSSFLFKEKITLIKIISLVITFGGCILCSYTASGFSLTVPTFIIGIGSGLCYGSYSIFSRFAINRGYKAETILIYTFIFAFLGSTLFVPYSSLINNLTKTSSYILPLLGLGVIATAVPYWLYTIGLKKTENGRASIIACMEIVSALMVGLILYNEIPSIYNIIGIILVFIAVIISSVKLKNTKRKS